MRLKKQSDYALRILMFLATHGEGTHTIKDIAQRFEISQNHLMKVVQSLAQLGYLHTVRGKNGGVRLGKPAKEIRIGQVLVQVGEQNELAECFIQTGNCKIEPGCRLKLALNKANQAFFASLDHYTLADIVDPPGQIIELLNLPGALTA